MVGKDFETDMKILTDQNKRSFFRAEIKLIILFRLVYNSTSYDHTYVVFDGMNLGLSRNFGPTVINLKTKISDKIGNFGFAEILDRIDNPKKYEEKAKTEEKEVKKEKLKEKLKTAANNNILKGGALLIAAQAMKKDIESEEEEEDENPFEVEDDEVRV